MAFVLELQGLEVASEERALVFSTVSNHCL
ncbi:MAG TPA: class III lanthipeptide [Micromonospora sp.]